MPNTPRNIEEKPYNACIDCANLGKTCDGPNFLAMDIDRWVEWCRLRKAYLHMTNQQLADISGVALPSIERIISGKTKDPLLSTIQRITKALVNGSWGQYPCADPAGQAAELAAECQQLRHDLTEAQKHEGEFRADAQAKVDFLKSQIDAKDRQIAEKDEQLKNRASAMNERWQIIESQKAEIKDHKREISHQKTLLLLHRLALAALAIIAMIGFATDKILF